MKPPKNKTNAHALLQFIVSFVVPLIILSRFSGESSLGPTRGFLLALVFPVVYEAYSIRKTKKPSLFSLLAIGGIVVTGVIGLLGLSEEWLAIRRSLPYAAGGVAILGSVYLKRPLLEMLLPKILDMNKVTIEAKNRQVQKKLKQCIHRSSYLLSVLLFVVAAASYILTKIVITSKTGTADFNQQYASLRVLSLPILSVPLFVGVIGIIMYLVHSIEKLTGLDIEQIMHSKPDSKSS